MTPTTVRTLLGEKTLDVSLKCLPTLLRYSADPVRLVIHEDGTLTENGRRALLEAMPGAEIVDRVVADERMEGDLARYPLCRAARTGSALFMKVFDIAFLEPGDLAYCDSDVLFLGPFTGLFGESDPRFRTSFMTDVKHSYAVRPWQLKPLGRVRLMGRVNSGLIRAARGAIDLDFLEWLLGRLQDRPVWSKRWYWAEQTCWAAVAARGPCGLWDSARVILATEDMGNYSPETVAIHFVSTYRNHLADYVGRHRPTDSAAVAIPIEPAWRVGSIGQFVSDLRARRG